MGTLILLLYEHYEQSNRDSFLGSFLVSLESDSDHINEAFKKSLRYVFFLALMLLFEWATFNNRCVLI